MYNIWNSSFRISQENADEDDGASSSSTNIQATSLLATSPTTTLSPSIQPLPPTSEQPDTVKVSKKRKLNSDKHFDEALLNIERKKAEALIELEKQKADLQMQLLKEQLKTEKLRVEVYQQLKDGNMAVKF